MEVPKQSENGSAQSGRQPRTLRTGRRVGPSTTRDEILAAARALFAEFGFERTTLRAVAERAGVNQALIYHFFDSKDDLLAALELPIDTTTIAAALSDNPGHEGEELVRRVLAAWRQPAVREYVLVQLRTAISHKQAADIMRDLFSTKLPDFFATISPGPNAHLRAALVGSQIAGIAVMRFLVGLDALTDADDDTIIRAVGPTLQRYLVGDLD